VKIIAFEREMPGINGEQFMPYLEAEAAKVWELYQSGLARELYFRQDRSTVVLVLECAGIEEARAALNELPLVRAGLIDFDLFPLRPYPGFARLFKPSGQVKSDQ
jgi:hypothetical protein